MRIRKAIIVFGVLTLMGMAASAIASSPIILVSVRQDGVQGNGHSVSVALSEDACLRAWAFYGNNLVPGVDDTNEVPDILSSDCKTAAIEYVTFGANGESNFPAMSADGNIIAFCTRATNLVPEKADANAAARDVVVYNRATGRAEFASVDSNGEQGEGGSCHPAINAQGNVVAFHSIARLHELDQDDTVDIFWRDLVSGETRLVSNDVEGDSFSPSLNCDGTSVLFHEEAPGGKANLYLASMSGEDIAPQRIGEGRLGSLNCDGTKGVFMGEDSRISYFELLPSGEVSFEPVNVVALFPRIDCAGNRISFTSPTDGTAHVYVHDRSMGKTWRVSESGGETRLSWLSAMSCDGGTVGFESLADLAGEPNDLWDIFLAQLPQNTCGDLNEDGYVTIQDVLLILQLATGERAPLASQPNRGDLNGDGVVNVLDVLLGLQGLVGIIPAMPC